VVDRRVVELSDMLLVETALFAHVHDPAAAPTVGLSRSVDAYCGS
jgi:hypothetical protein